MTMNVVSAGLGLRAEVRAALGELEVVGDARPRRDGWAALDVTGSLLALDGAPRPRAARTAPWPPRDRPSPVARSRSDLLPPRRPASGSRYSSSRASRPSSSIWT